jgi:hypothetical protein
MVSMFFLKWLDSFKTLPQIPRPFCMSLVVSNIGNLLHALIFFLKTWKKMFEYFTLKPLFFLIHVILIVVYLELFL